MKISVLGVDLGKNVCSLVGFDASGAVVLRRRAFHRSRRLATSGRSCSEARRLYGMARPSFRRCTPFTEGRFGDEALTSGAAAMGARHVGFGPGLVDEDKPDPHVSGGAALRRPHRALRHRRTDQWRRICFSLNRSRFRHLDIVDEKRILFDRVAHLIGVFRSVSRTRPSPQTGSSFILTTRTLRALLAIMT
jgi:hypothetical protein